MAMEGLAKQRLSEDRRQKAGPGGWRDTRYWLWAELSWDLGEMARSKVKVVSRVSEHLCSFNWEGGWGGQAHRSFISSQ